MAPALRHMGWLAGLCVLSVWVYMCVLGECDASPNANACCFKKWEPLSPLLSFLFGKVYYGLLVLAVIFFSSSKGRTARKMHLSSILKIIDLLMRKIISEILYFSARGLFDLRVKMCIICTC